MSASNITTRYARNGTVQRTSSYTDGWHPVNTGSASNFFEDFLGYSSENSGTNYVFQIKFTASAPFKAVTFSFWAQTIQNANHGMGTRTFNAGVSSSPTAQVNNTASTTGQGKVVISAGANDYTQNQVTSTITLAAVLPAGTYYISVWAARKEFDIDMIRAKVSAPYTVTVTTSDVTAYTIQYNANGGTGAPANQTKYSTVTLTLSSQKPTRASANGGTATIAFNVNGGSGSVASKTSTRTTTYTFSKWNTAANGSGTNYNSGGSYTADAAATLYAIWTSSTGAYPNISLPSGPSRSATTSTATVTFVYQDDSTANSTANSTRSTSYTFKGWNTNSSATTGTAAGTSVAVTGSTTYYAIWQSSTGSYNAITLPSPTRKGYTFEGWATTSTAASGLKGSYTPSGSITLYAIWKKMADANGTIQIDNGTAFAPYVVYIDNGTSWDLYVPYIDTGTSWARYS